jgi:hypothetical protein
MSWWMASAAAVAEAAPSLGAAAIVCQRTFSCATWVDSRSTACAEAIGGSRIFHDQPLFVLSPSDQIAKLDGGTVYSLEIRKDTIRLSRQRLVSLAMIDHQSIIDRATGTLSGRTIIRFRGEAKIVEFRFAGTCTPLNGSIARDLLPSPREREAATLSQSH